MRKIFFLLSMLIPLISHASDGYKSVFESNQRLILLFIKCSPCDLVCDNIEYQILNKKDGSEINASGNTINLGVSKNFRGYTFDKDNLTYSLTDYNNDGEWGLNISKTLPDGSYSIISTEKLSMIFHNRSC